MKYELTNFCEIDKFASESYSRIHNEPLSKNLGDISLVDTSAISNFDLLVGGSPCFIAGTKILTKTGYKNIEEIESGEFVLTHKNRYQKVLRVGGEKNKEIYELSSDGFLPIYCTDYHPFYCKKDKDAMPNKMKLIDLKSGYYIGSHINTESQNIYNFSTNDCHNLGFQSKDHLIPIFILNLPTRKLKAFLTGYFERYGESRNNQFKLFVMNKENLLTLCMIIQKVYQIGCYPYKKDDRYYIEFELNEESPKWFIENNIVWYPITKIKKTEVQQDVYNIEVEEDHTYTANNVITYNCQDLSLAGKKNGATYTCKNCGHKYNPLEAHYTKRDECPICGSKKLEKTRSSLIVEYLRFLREKQPMFAIYENVKNIIGKEFRPMFDLFIEEVKEIGYVPYWEVLNAKYYGIPQNRERVIGVFIRKDIDHGFTYPKKLDVIYTINDILQKNIPQNYYIDLNKSEPLVRELIVRGKLSENENYLWNKNFIHNLGLLEMKGSTQCRRVYGKDGISPTLDTCQGGNHQVKILENSHKAFNINPSHRGMSGCVYFVDAVSPTLSTNELKILLSQSLPCIASEYRTDVHYLTYRDNVCGTLRTIDSCGCKRIIEPIDLPICVASRGRYKDNTTKRISGLPTVQRLEPNEFGTFNTLTSVQKDNYILEDANKTYMNIKFLDVSFPMHFEYEERLPIEKKDEKFEIFQELKMYFYKNNKFPSCYNLNTKSEFILGENDKHLIMFSEKQLNILFKVWGETGYRVRKLTPRESFRLMGFSDKAYDAARYYTDTEKDELDKLNKKYRTEYDLTGKERAIKLSDAQAYKQAGNSIVVNVLYYVFSELKKQYKEFNDGIKLCSLFSGIGAFEQGLNAVENEEILLKIND